MSTIEVFAISKMRHCMIYLCILLKSRMIFYQLFIFINIRHFDFLLLIKSIVECL